MLEVSASGWLGRTVPACSRRAAHNQTATKLFLGVGQVLFVRAFEVFDFAAFEMPDAGGDFVDDVVVVGY